MNPSAKSTNPHAVIWISLVVATLAAHGILVFTDYVIWDGFISLRGFSNPEGREHMLRWFSEAGRPLDYYIYRLLFLLPEPVLAAKVAGVVAWGACGALIFAVLRAATPIPAKLGGAVAVLATCLPVFELLGDATFWTHEFALTCFWLGWFVLTAKIAVGAARWRWVALGLFFISFNLNSLLVFYYAVALAMFVLRLPSRSLGLAWKEGWRLVARHSDLALLPIVFWGLKLLITPTSGFYAEYNSLDSAPERIATGYRSLLENLFLGERFKAGQLGWLWLAVPPVATLAVWVRRRLGRASIISANSLSRAEVPQLELRLIAVGVLLFLAGALPYILVGQQLSIQGWLSRNSILLPLPLAMIGVGIGLVAKSRISIGWLRALAFPVFVAVVTMAALQANLGYLTLQGQGAKQEAIRLKLGKAIREHSAAAVQLRDYFVIPGTDDRCPPAVWTCMLAAPGRLPEVFVFDAVKLADHRTIDGPGGQMSLEIPFLEVDATSLGQMIAETSIPFMFERLPRTGPQILFVVQSGRHGDDGRVLGAKYLGFKWKSLDRLQPFLEEVIEASVFVLPPIAR